MEEETQNPEHGTRMQREATAPRAASFAVPISIVIGFALVAGAIYFSGATTASPGTQNAANVLGTDTPTTGEVRPIDDTDHIRGNPNAPIIMIEYSDYDCPFCKNFHETMKRVMQNYGTDGKVAWVYRHFPLEQLHPSAPYIAEASECVAALGGNDAFWKFSDLVFGERGTNEPTNTARLSEFAKTAGVSESAFSACLEDGRTQPLVKEDIQDAIAAGGKGTPHTLVLVGGQQGIISGAQPYETVSKILDTLIAQMENPQ
jgi:protein-disulfide isomerase